MLISTVFSGLASIALLAKNLNYYIGATVESQGMSIYLSEQIDAGDLKSLLEDFHGDPRVKQVVHRNKSQAWQLLSTELGANSSLLAGFTAENNPLPASIEVDFKRNQVSPDFLKVLSSQLMNIEGVELVQYDDSFAIVYRDLLIYLKVFLNCVAPVLFLGACFVVWMALRLGIYACRAELELKCLLGASPWFLWSPYILEGMLLGLVGAGLGLLFVWLCVSIVKVLLAAHLSLLPMNVMSLNLIEIGLLLIVGLIIGALGGGLAVRNALSK
jgi:cell division transport system permease protein